MKSNAQKVNDAIKRAEETACDLILAAEAFARVSTNDWDVRCNRIALLGAARRYTNAVRRLARLT